MLVLVSTDDVNKPTNKLYHQTEPVQIWLTNITWYNIRTHIETDNNILSSSTTALYLHLTNNYLTNESNWETLHVISKVWKFEFSAILLLFLEHFQNSHLRLYSSDYSVTNKSLYQSSAKHYTLAKLYKPHTNATHCLMSHQQWTLRER